MPQKCCPHERLSRYNKSENLVGLIVAVTGRPSQGKTALAEEIAKALRCTFLDHDRLSFCIPAGDRSNSDDDPTYRILWKMIETHLNRRNHHVVVNSPMSRRVELDRLVGLAESHDAVVILIEFVEADCDENTNREGEAALVRDLERSLALEDGLDDDGFYDYDLRKIDIPKLIIKSTSGADLHEHVDSVEKLILTSLDEMFTMVEGDSTLTSGCSRCTLDEVRRWSTRYPETFKHELHADEFYLEIPESVIQKGSTCMFTCRACLRRGGNLYYTWGELYFHPECVLELPLQVDHKCHWHPLKLTLLPPKDETDEYYCEVCAERRDADSWIYYCQECEYEAHVPCVVPQLPDHY
ncbi:hypothetical protein MLD38_020053 [Melastoma candidum]|uniref:Uncharacterized protein n=1 Tax=Melastoma candidum TaxID=119954 RepID=A0ACB9QEP2_9MYRT|nr:hypothetical protein MLD38_020053 [Melastoma candidum]